MKRIFLQFYYLNLLRIKAKFRLHNGFSSVWELSNPIWVVTDPFEKNIPPLPEEANEIYCSIFTEYEFTIARSWASANPQIKFILGGPAIWPRNELSTKSFGVVSRTDNFTPLPENVEIRLGLAEDIFNTNWKPDRWHVELPDAVKSEVVLYSYYVYDECYWGKCTFCNKSWDGTSLIDPKWKRGCNSFSALENAPPGIIWLATDSMPPHLLELLPDLPQDKSYMFAMRAGTEEARIVDCFTNEIQHSDEIRFFPQIGIEFPSSRMLKRMKKGITIDNLLKVLNILTLNPSIAVVCNLIIGWPDLIEEDIKEAEEFYSKLENPEKIKFALNWLYLPGCKSQNKIINYFSKLDDKAFNLNKKYFEILTETYRITDVDYAPVAKKWIAQNFDVKKEDHLIGC